MAGLEHGSSQCGTSAQASYSDGRSIPARAGFLLCNMLSSGWPRTRRYRPN
ncbi:DUF1190 domain-containing protein [Streptosporangium minutum]|uniref:DUF1190 domain-containing protein n=1 Tax=Streptosporangium minutum TaxID=569862 RepID=UPI003BF9BCF6